MSLWMFGDDGSGLTAMLRERITAPRLEFPSPHDVIYAEPNMTCDSIYCDPKSCHGVIKHCNSGETILCKCSCHKKAGSDCQ